VTRQIVEILKPILDVIFLLIFFILIFSLLGKRFNSAICSSMVLLCGIFSCAGYLIFAEKDPDVRYLEYFFVLLNYIVLFYFIVFQNL